MRRTTLAPMVLAVEAGGLPCRNRLNRRHCLATRVKTELVMEAAYSKGTTGGPGAGGGTVGSAFGPSRRDSVGARTAVIGRPRPVRCREGEGGWCPFLASLLLGECGAESSEGALSVFSAVG